MRNHDFDVWLERGYRKTDGAPLDSATRVARASGVQRLERALGDLDEHWARDGGRTVVEKLTFSRADCARGRPLPPGIRIDGDVYTGVATLRRSAVLYFQFCAACPQGTAAPTPQKAPLASPPATAVRSAPPTPTPRERPEPAPRNVLPLEGRRAPWPHSSRQTAAWYSGTREEFLASTQDAIADRLAGRAASESLTIEPAQTTEWKQSVAVLQRNLNENVSILRRALLDPVCEAVHHVILEYSFRRRGLRMDCLLIAEGALFVVEFKRTKLERADHDQVMNYAVNLIEFHRATQDWCAQGNAIVVPVLALTEGQIPARIDWPGFAGHHWTALARKPLPCDQETLRDALALGLEHRRSKARVSGESWLDSTFRPSSSILDATLSLYGNHDVVAIDDHAAPKAAIDAATQEIREHIDSALKANAYHIVFLSGAPGSGKTLVGLDLVMRGSQARGSVFVTGNAPLVDVLNKALSTSYRAQGRASASWAPTGYPRSDAQFVSSAATFKIVKAHDFLGKRGDAHRQEDGRVLVFDEAQRTYEKGRMVMGEKLAEHEADLILDVQRKAFPQGGAVVVALVGHNQAINRGERGIVAWLEAARRLGWSFSISDETLELAEFQQDSGWTGDPRRRRLEHGHLRQSMRYYRNAAVEEWADAVLLGDASKAQALATGIAQHGDTIRLTRSLDAARRWARHRAVGSERAGLIASGQARRLAAEGLFVDYKPDIATWMLAPSSDIRSSNALETVQNQYQVQGLELDHCIVCWDADLRREGSTWAAYKLSGSDWQRDGMLTVAQSGYRVLLTRARKGMLLFVPVGDPTGEDATRDPAFYDGVWEFLLACGALPLDS